ncbi:MAG: nucleoside hydrolase [Alphaproteobacteria bacterium]|nr:nucleoside hydrolase [Alphaproteobacteria bacterium]
MARKLILDVDTGTDDAVAIMLAALHPDLELIGVTTVNGNVEVRYCTDNTLRTLDFIGRGDIPVFEGLNRPLTRADFPIPRALKKSTGVHVAELPLPAPTSVKHNKGAVEYLIETYRAATEEIVLVPTGPLSNIAAAIALYPKLVELVPEVVLMGGAHHHGNVTPSAEFNIWADPDASASVFAAGFRKLVCVPLDATHEALVSLADTAAMEALGTPSGIAASRFISHRIRAYDANQPMAERGAAPVHDALCIAYLVDPSVITTDFRHVAVETMGPLTMGRTVVDTNFRGENPPNCHFAFHADRAKFVAMMLETFARTA